MKGRLYTSKGDLVTEFIMMPFQLTPEVAFWGSRVFVLRSPFDQEFGSPAKPDYYEVCAWSVDASKAFEGSPDYPVQLKGQDE